MATIGRMFSGLQFRLLLLVVVSCAPLVALTLHNASEDRRRQERSWAQRAQRLSEFTRHEEDGLIGGVTQLLLALAESSQVQSGDGLNTRLLLQDLLKSYPKYWNFGVVGTNAGVLVSAAALPDSFGDAEHSRFEKALRSGGLTVGKVLTEEGQDGGLLFAYPCIDHLGVTRGVVFALLRLPWISFDAATIGSLPKSATWEEIDQNGIIQARHPRPEEWVGRPLANRNLLAKVSASPAGTYEEAGASRHYYAYLTRSSKLFGQSTVVLGTTKESLFAWSDRALRWNLAWLGCTLLLALTLGWIGSRFLVLRPVKALVRSSARLAAGDLTARTGLKHYGGDELGQLTLAFDQMAQALEQREKERLKASQKLQVLSHRLVEVQESERRHIARELHDEIGQALTAAEMNLQAALRAPDASSLKRRLQASIQSVEQVLEQVHDLSLNLRPSMLDDLGLEAALRWYARRQGELADLRTDFSSDLMDKRLPLIVETECFRVAQEALTNVVRHARARCVSVELRQADGRLELTVRDDGAGFNVQRLREEAVQGASMGLLSMEERATLAGGGMELISAPEKGTEVHAWFPLEVAALENKVETSEND